MPLIFPWGATAAHEAVAFYFKVAAGVFVAAAMAYAAIALFYPVRTRKPQILCRFSFWCHVLLLKEGDSFVAPRNSMHRIPIRRLAVYVRSFVEWLPEKRRIFALVYTSKFSTLQWRTAVRN